MRFTARFVTVSALCICYGCDTPQSPSPLPVDNQPAPALNLGLPPAPAPPGIASGDYQIAIVAQNCDGLGRSVLPIELRTRQYPAMVQQNGADITVTLITKSSTADLWGRIEGDGRASLTNYYGNDQWDAIWEFLTPQRFIEILVENMNVNVSPDGALSTGTFQGYIGTAREDNGDTESSCLSSTHSVAFMRR